MAQAKHTPMPATDQGSTVSRRTLITAGPFTALAAVIAQRAQAVPAETPVMALYREWKAHHDWIETKGGKALDEDAFNARCRQNEDLASRLIALPCQSAADLAAKLMAASLCGIGGLTGTDMGLAVLAEARALVA